MWACNIFGRTVDHAVRRSVRSGPVKVYLWCIPGIYQVHIVCRPSTFGSSVYSWQIADGAAVSQSPGPPRFLSSQGRQAAAFKLVAPLCFPSLVTPSHQFDLFNCYAGPADPPCRRHHHRPGPSLSLLPSPSPPGQSPRTAARAAKAKAASPCTGGRRRAARADGCPVGAPRAVMNIKHPCKPKPVCRGIPTAILLQAGWQDFKCAGITLVYTSYIPGLEIADSEKISLVYPSHILFT